MPTNPTSFQDTVALLARRLNDADLPGALAQLSMAPGYRADISRVTIHEKKCVEAAVLALVVPAEGGSLVLTVRRPTLKHHGGQVSFPGGRREAGESLVDTALRECHEEIGVEPADVTVLGALTPLFIPPTHFCVYPFVAWTASSHLAPGEDEVERVITLPISRLNAADLRATHRRTFADKEYDVPHYAIAGEVVWGATAMILGELAAAIREEDD
jgi:8-oxo-dGTP pyrophosphatase MutT (NUDIX family)